MKAEGSKAIADNLVEIYREEILDQRNRRVQLLGRKCHPRFVHTFLGYELYLGKKRLTCPDMASVRYLAIFAELGLKSVGIPYDITRTASLVPALEQLFDKLKQAAQNEGRPLTEAYRQLRRRITAAEAAAGVPESV